MSDTCKVCGKPVGCKVNHKSLALQTCGNRECVKEAKNRAMKAFMRCKVGAYVPGRAATGMSAKIYEVVE